MNDVFVLNAEALQKGWGADGQYWFSLKNYRVRNHYEFADNDRPEDVSETQFMLSMGYIPYFRVSRIELAKAYIDAIGSIKLKEKMAAIDDEAEYIETFWKCYNVYPHLSEGYEEFQNNYLIKKAIDWCDENHISYDLV